ncbi:DUF2892 domain-containing protein [Brevibacillus humidisoli]|uniref:YgaP family membrane protein n=1 Tax=Brevibacillus humidisoli TaxID=2895522 RepID=UPI001E46BD48|nr:DUF2892 domain-containing protein [Brevibacillus humidisoli]UFJ41017.1 DUF2892 domain-containing protein [Brevibacillus humidisoli]
MRKNVGTLDATIRITAGIMGLAYSVGRMSRRPYRTPWMLMFLSAMKVAEGVTRFCPMLYSMGTSTRDGEGMKMMRNMMGNGNQDHTHHNKQSANSQKRDQVRSDQMMPANQTIQSIANEMEEVLTSASRENHSTETNRQKNASESTRNRSAREYREEERLYPTY